MDASGRSAPGRFKASTESSAEAKSLAATTPAARDFFVSYLLNNRNY